METVSRFFKAPKASFFLFGPRGTGKSTWLRQSFPDALVIDLLDPESLRAYQAQPERLIGAVDAAPPDAAVVIDEVQRIPQLLSVVHKLIEDPRRRGRRFILTGSSARKIKRAGVDLLAGRAVMKSLHPFLAAELGSRFDLERSLRLGMLPVVHGAADPEAALRAYAGLYVREEVQAEALVRDVGAFSRFLESISLSHASLLNLAEVSRAGEVGRKTAEGFLDVLEDLLLGFRLPVFAKRAKRQLIQHAKFYYMDAGVFRAVRPQGPLDSPAEIGGACLEGLVAQHLRAWIAYRGDQESLYFWRTRAGSEVDFIVYGPGTFLAVEVKASRRVSGNDLRALRAFREDYPEAKACFLYGGSERLRLDGIDCIPCGEFLMRLEPSASAAELLA